MSSPRSEPVTSRFAGFESIPIRVTVRVGHARLTLERLSRLEVGEVVVLDQQVGAPFALVAGEVLLGLAEPVASDTGIALKLIGSTESEDDDGDS
jgi:flagellar motor switch/type III secretory pathway protein FliN